jgi:hypothetical protein
VLRCLNPRCVVRKARDSNNTDNDANWMHACRGQRCRQLGGSATPASIPLPNVLLQSFHECVESHPAAWTVAQVLVHGDPGFERQ